MTATITRRLVSLAGAFALSGLVAWDALFGDRRDDDPMKSPLLGYLLLDVLTVVLAIAALGTVALGNRRWMHPS